MIVLIITAIAVAAVRSGDGGSNPSGIAPVNTQELAPNAPPEVQLLATVGAGRLRDRLLIYVPVSQQRITAIVYHATGAAGAIELAARVPSPAPASLPAITAGIGTRSASPARWRRWGIPRRRAASASERARPPVKPARVRPAASPIRSPLLPASSHRAAKTSSAARPAIGATLILRSC
jgi:hypothetical protein